MGGAGAGDWKRRHLYTNGMKINTISSSMRMAGRANEEDTLGDEDEEIVERERLDSKMDGKMAIFWEQCTVRLGA